MSETQSPAKLFRAYTPADQHRADVHYGTPYARLDRNQRILKFHEEELKIMRCASLATFRVWDDYRARLNDQYTDDYIYADYWRKFIDHILNDWKTVASQVSTRLDTAKFALTNSLSPCLCSSLMPHYFSCLRTRRSRSRPPPSQA